MAFFLLWQLEAVLRDEIHQQLGEDTGLLEPFNLNSQAVKVATRQAEVIYNHTFRNKVRNRTGDVNASVSDSERETQTKTEKAVCGGRPSSFLKTCCGNE